MYIVIATKTKQKWHLYFNKKEHRRLESQTLNCHFIATDNLKSWPEQCSAERISEAAVHVR